MFTEDLSVFFDEDDFAHTATLNGTASGNVILDREYLRQLQLVSSTDPVALARADQYGTSVINGTLVTNGGTYVIKDREPVEDGATVLLQLEEQ